MRRIVVASIGLLLALSGCGGASSESNPLAVIVLAADKTQEAGTARVWMDMQMEGRTGLITSTADGVMDMASGRGEVTMEMDMPDLPAGTPALGTIETVFEGTTIYMKMPALAAQLPPGKPWMSFDLQEVGEEMGLDFGALMQSGNSDPTQSLQYLRGAAGEVETLGEEQVRGVQTTRYRASVSFDKMIEQAPEDLRPRLEPTVDAVAEWIGADEIPVEVWIDEQGRMLRQKQNFEYVAGPARGTSVAMTLEMYDFGVDVEVEVPPSSQVTDLRELMEGMSPRSS